MADRIQNFTELVVWQKAHCLMLAIYECASLFPRDEKYGRVQQIRRSAASVPANIAEGFGRYHYQENIQFCRQARGSLEETKNHLIATKDLQQLDLENCNALLEKCDEVRALLNGYIRSLQISKSKSSND